MADTTFSAGTVVASAWLNDVNDFVYGNVATLLQHDVPENGTTDCTTAIQAALDSGATRLVGTPGVTYIVSHTGTQTVNATAQRYCLNIPTGVVLDLNGSTIKAANSSNSSPVMLYSVTDSGVVNGTIDCNQANQTTPATGEIAGIYSYGCTRPVVRDIKAINCLMYAGRFLGNTGGKYHNLVCTGSDADGWSFGITGSAGELREFEADINNVYATACTQTYGGGYQGNPVIFCTKNSTIGNVIGKHSSGGVKIQDMAEDSSFASLSFIGQTNGGVNSGVKIQGNGAGLQPTRIKVGSINSIDAYGSGLYIYDCMSVEVGKYQGSGNGTGAGATGSDKFDFNADVPTSGRLMIGTIDSDSPGSQCGRVQGAGFCKIDTFNGVDPTGIGLSYAGTGEFYCDDVRITDSASGMTYAFRATGGKGYIGRVSTDKAHSTGQSRVTVDAGLYDWAIGAIRLGSTDIPNQIVTLATGPATATAVTNGHLWRDAVGGVADYFQPIVQVIPWNAAARTLDADGGLTFVPTDGSSATGGSLKHPSNNTASVKYILQILEWRTLATASS